MFPPPPPSRIAYLILAHRNPAHLGRLVRRLTTPQATCFVHVDRKAPFAPFAAALAGTGAVLSDQRIAVRWGGFGMVRATLMLLEQAFADARGFERFVLLSGTDYPIRSTAAIEAFFAQHAGDEFIEMLPFGKDGKSEERLSRYHPDVPRALQRGLRLLERLGLVARWRDHRAVLGDLVPYGGASWWALSRLAAAHVLAFGRQRPEIVQFMSTTACPDEHYFQTILGNSPFRTRLRGGLTYADWSGGAASPAWLTHRHLDVLREIGTSTPDRVGHLFARKCPEPSDEIVRQIEAMIAARPRDEALAD